MEKRNRFFAILLIAVGAFILFGKWISFMTIAAFFFILYGIYKIKHEQVRKGYTLLSVGAGLLLLDHLIMIIAIALISLGLFYAKTTQIQSRKGLIKTQNFMTHVDLDDHPWILRSTGMWHVLGEVDIDLSLAIAEEQENLLLLEGMFGDIDLTLPVHYGVEVDALVLFGRIKFGQDRETSMMNRLNWKSPNYDTAEQKVKVVISYMVGDISVRIS
ncbi:cell wall-active antibiotics response protein LiaF [Paenibacillus sediminis]|uniref:Lia operon protein LiaF n=1 Tax=Paenibacillus sediminis TaxID=664909 RepID=A0ABS4H7H2_9BACL|nr:cell wall-active antibiotics response protein LiaF [Paenibacillus sediminis]MBP1938480.1 lia operon protein LiaF [Paenibacillus sediminis]